MQCSVVEYEWAIVGGWVGVEFFEFGSCFLGFDIFSFVTCTYSPYSCKSTRRFKRRFQFLKTRRLALKRECGSSTTELSVTKYPV